MGPHLQFLQYICIHFWFIFLSMAGSNLGPFSFTLTSHRDLHQLSPRTLTALQTDHDRGPAPPNPHPIIWRKDLHDQNFCMRKTLCVHVSIHTFVRLLFSSLLSLYPYSFVNAGRRPTFSVYTFTMPTPKHFGFIYSYSLFLITCFSLHFFTCSMAQTQVSRKALCIQKRR